MQIKPNKFLVLTPLVFLVIIILLIIAFIKKPDNSESGNWELLLTTSKPEEIYYQLKKDSLNKPPSEQHHIVHLFGQFLYQKMGLEAISVCDAAFAFGCFHGVYTEAVKDKGINISLELDKICEEKYGSSKLGCQHGIGHGILSHLGHNKLDEALAQCAKLATKKASLECDTGVFMEYNFPLISSHHHSGRTIRESQGDIFAPCNKVNDQHKNACYYILVQWWDKLFEFDYQKLGLLCNSLQNQSQKQACFLGIGDLLADASNFEPEEVIKACNNMPGEENSVLCRAGAKGIFYAVLNYRHLSQDLCTNLRPDLEKMCNSRSNFFLLQ